MYTKLFFNQPFSTGQIVLNQFFQIFNAREKSAISADWNRAKPFFATALTRLRPMSWTG
jgi:hypothetical protein